MMSDDYKLLGQRTGARVEHKVSKKKHTVSELGVVSKIVGGKGYSVKPTVVLNKDNEVVKYEDFYTLQDSITIKHLIDLCEEPSYTVPQGLSREERKEWAKQTVISKGLAERMESSQPVVVRDEEHFKALQLSDIQKKERYRRVAELEGKLLNKKNAFFSEKYQSPITEVSGIQKELNDISEWFLKVKDLQQFVEIDYPDFISDVQKIEEVFKKWVNIPKLNSIDDLEDLVENNTDDNTTYLSDSAWNKLQEVLDNPPEPNEAMKKLMEESKND